MLDLQSREERISIHRRSCLSNVHFRCAFRQSSTHSRIFHLVSSTSRQIGIHRHATLGATLCCDGSATLMEIPDDSRHFSSFSSSSYLLAQWRMFLSFLCTSRARKASDCYDSIVRNIRPSMWLSASSPSSQNQRVRRCLRPLNLPSLAA